ncbi:MAG: hypothetical protein WCX75_06965 [Fibrobacteraceae bacterium]
MKVWMAGIPVLCGILLFGVNVYAQEKEKIGSEPFAEFCVSFKAEPECSICNTCNETDNKHYSFHLLKEIDIPRDSEWEYPDSLDNCGHVYWKYYFRMDVVDKGLLFDDNESGNGEEYGYRGDYSNFPVKIVPKRPKEKIGRSSFVAPCRYHFFNTLFLGRLSRFFESVLWKNIQDRVECPFELWLPPLYGETDFSYF